MRAHFGKVSSQNSDGISESDTVVLFLRDCSCSPWYWLWQSEVHWFHTAFLGHRNLMQLDLLVLTYIHTPHVKRNSMESASDRSTKVHQKEGILHARWTIYVARRIIGTFCRLEKKYDCNILRVFNLLGPWTHTDHPIYLTNHFHLVHKQQKKYTVSCASSTLSK